MRRCRVCQQEKPDHEMTAAYNRPTTICRVCDNKQHRDYYYAHERGRRNWRRMYRQSNRAHVRVRDRLRRAVVDGRVKKPGECGRCHRELPRRRIHAHHADYSKPFTVEWLCVGCHKQEHATPWSLRYDGQ